GTRKILVTALDLDRNATRTSSETAAAGLQERIKLAIDVSTRNESARKNGESEAESKSTPPAQLNTRTSTEEPASAILNELKNGYDMICVGLEGALSHDARNPNVFSSSIEQIIREFKGALAISVVKKEVEPPTAEQINILVPATGTAYSRRAAEVA